MRISPLLFGGDVADDGVDSLTIVVALDIGEQVASRGIPIGVFALVNEFGFQGAEETPWAGNACCRSCRAIAAWRPSPDTILAHHLLDPLAADGVALGPQLGMVRGAPYRSRW